MAQESIPAVPVECAYRIATGSLLLRKPPLSLLWFGLALQVDQVAARVVSQWVAEVVQRVFAIRERTLPSLRTA